MFYVYGLRERGSSEYRYVGRTVDPERRLKAHRAMSRSSKTDLNPGLAAWLESIGDDPVMDILHTGERGGRQTEQAWIEKMSNDGHRLLNMKPASQTYSSFADLPASERRDTIARYLDRFEEVTDKPWLKERQAPYFTL